MITPRDLRTGENPRSGAKKRFSPYIWANVSEPPNSRCSTLEKPSIQLPASASRTTRGLPMNRALV